MILVFGSSEVGTEQLSLPLEPTRKGESTPHGELESRGGKQWIQLGTGCIVSHGGLRAMAMGVPITKGSGPHFHEAQLTPPHLQGQHRVPCAVGCGKSNAPEKSSLLGAHCTFKELQVRGAKFSGESQQRRKSLTFAW